MEKNEAKWSTVKEEDEAAVAIVFCLYKRGIEMFLGRMKCEEEGEEYRVLIEKLRESQFSDPQVLKYKKIINFIKFGVYLN